MARKDFDGPDIWGNKSLHVIAYVTMNSSENRMSAMSGAKAQNGSMHIAIKLVTIS